MGRLKNFFVVVGQPTHPNPKRARELSEYIASISAELCRIETRLKRIEAWQKQQQNKKPVQQ